MENVVERLYGSFTPLLPGEAPLAPPSSILTHDHLINAISNKIALLSSSTTLLTKMSLAQVASTIYKTTTLRRSFSTAKFLDLKSCHTDGPRKEVSFEAGK